MATTKERRNYLIRLADETLRNHAFFLNGEIDKKEIQIRDTPDNKTKELLKTEKKILEAKKILRMKDDICDVLDSYNGQVASLSVSIAMSGLLPSLAIFYQDKPEPNAKKAYRRNVLDVIARMIIADDNNNSGFIVNNNYSESLFRHAIKLEYSLKEDKSKKLEYSSIKEDKSKLNNLKKEIIECSIALKQVVRTYNLVKS